jgi:hypothetical protein
LREREEIVVIEKFARIVACAGMAGTIVAASALIVSGALAQEIRLTRSVASSAQSLLVDERSWDANCKPLATSVTITKQPSNGNVTVVPGVSVIAVSTPQSASTGRCGGKSVTGNHVLYRSNPGFRGTDTLAYKVQYGNGRSATTTVTIDVQ